jgi:hypothetical protein
MTSITSVEKMKISRPWYFISKYDVGVVSDLEVEEAARSCSHSESFVAVGASVQRGGRGCLLDWLFRLFGLSRLFDG